MTPPYDPHEARMQDLEHRVADLEDGPYVCVECDAPYNSRNAAERCAEEDRKPDPR